MAILENNKDTMGRFLTEALFYETRNKKYTATFTLKEKDHKVEDITYISMRRLYLEIEDPTEYLFAEQVLGSWDHWQKLCRVKQFMEYVSSWREELSTKLKAKAIQAMIATATEDGSKGITAAKWLASAGWEEGKGRPSKEKVEGKVKQAIQAVSNIENDAVRLGLTRH